MYSCGFHSIRYLISCLIKLGTGAKQSGKPERLINLLNYSNVINVKSDLSYIALQRTWVE